MYVLRIESTGEIVFTADRKLDIARWIMDNDHNVKYSLKWEK